MKGMPGERGYLLARPFFDFEILKLEISTRSFVPPLRVSAFSGMPKAHAIRNCILSTC